MRRFRRRLVGAGGVAARLEAGEAARLGLVAVDGERLVVAPAGMGDVIDAAAERSAAPGVENVEDERSVDGHGRMHRHRRLPRLVAHRRDRDALGRRPAQRHTAPVAGDDVAIGVGGGQLHLQPFGRTVGVTRGAADRAGLAEHMPGLQRLAQLELNALVVDLAAERKTKFRLRLVPVGPEG